MRIQPAQRTDLAIVIASKEEFREFLALAGTVSQYKTDTSTAYRFNRGRYRVVASLVGEMGAAPAGRIAERLMDDWQPESIVCIGIATGVHEDLRVGDVFVPTQADEYIQDPNAIPAVDDPASLAFVSVGPTRRTDFKVLDGVQKLEFGHTQEYKEFVDDCAKDLEQLLRDPEKRQQLAEQHLIRNEVGVCTDGHVVTAPVAGAAEAFTKWIRGHDRHAKALEMETAGVYMRAHEHGKGTRAFAIRGISDYGDGRKQALDAIGGGALRKYAMRNAVRFLWALIDSNVLPTSKS